MIVQTFDEVLLGRGKVDKDGIAVRKTDSDKATGFKVYLMVKVSWLVIYQLEY